MKRTVFITGATSGIGEAVARQLAELPYRLILCGRNRKKLDELQISLGKITEVTTLCFDVADKKSVFSGVESLSADWKNIDVLINNAGNAHGLATFADADLTDLEAMIDINVKGLIYVTKAVLPQMNATKNGHIVNLSSIAGKQTYENGVVYCASKKAVEALSEGLRQELVGQGIKVSNVAPGAVNTNFSAVRFKGDTAKADAVYAGFEPLLAEDIADVITYILQAPPHVNVADVLILPKAQASGTKIVR
ncbi:MAG: SDR family NAD(P)-dependent oxidoreductase [Capnocytophaga sp.]|nr:SDR family NAD(P)-dependent oxidoreductase [Capnocytophaga sp.]